MLRKRFFVKIVLQLHAITCPGVWLCRHGYLEVTIKTLGYLHRSSGMEPRFPLLPHDEFIIQGFFKSVDNMDELDRILSAEKIEITLWQNGRRLAYYVGKLIDLMEADMLPQLNCKHNINVQLLMRATPAFPGILLPKIELSANVSTRDHFGSSKNRCKVNGIGIGNRIASSSSSEICSSSDYCGRFISPNFRSKAIRPKNRHMNCCDYLGVPRRQLPVCHTRHCSSETAYMSDKSSTPKGFGFEAELLNNKKTTRRLSESSSQTFVLSHCSNSAPKEFSSRKDWASQMDPDSNIDDGHQDYCEICLNYRRAFMDSKI